MGLTMFLVVRVDGRYWDGQGWGAQGKIFLSVASATRSLHEEGEDIEATKILDLEVQK